MPGVVGPPQPELTSLATIEWLLQSSPGTFHMAARTWPLALASTFTRCTDHVMNAYISPVFVHPHPWGRHHLLSHKLKRSSHLQLLAYSLSHLPSLSAAPLTGPPLECARRSASVFQFHRPWPSTSSCFLALPTSVLGPQWLDQRELNPWCCHSPAQIPVTSRKNVQTLTSNPHIPQSHPGISAAGIPLDLTLHVFSSPAGSLVIP